MPSTISTTEVKHSKSQQNHLGIIDILLATLPIGVALGLANAWDIAGGIWGGLLTAATLVVIRRRSVGSLLALLLLVVLVVVGLRIAWNDYVFVRGSLGMIQGHQIHYQLSDKAYFEAYSMVLYTGEHGRADTKDRVLTLRDRTIRFPGDANVALVNDLDDVRFVTVPDGYFVRKPPSSGLYIAGIPCPRFKSDQNFKGSLDLNRLEGTPTWNDEIAPFLLKNASAE